MIGARGQNNARRKKKTTSQQEHCKTSLVRAASFGEVPTPIRFQDSLSQPVIHLLGRVFVNRPVPMNSVAMLCRDTSNPVTLGLSDVTDRLAVRPVVRAKFAGVG